jgi:predicted transcriptional regulator
MPDDGSITIKLDPQTAQQLAERAREEGVTPEQYAAELVAEGVAIDIDTPPPEFIESEAELRASIAEQMRQIESGEAVLIPHEQVMAEVRAKLAAAKARKA